MRGCDHQSGSLFSYVDLEKRIRPDHPLRTIRRLVDDALASLDRRPARPRARGSRLGRWTLSSAAEPSERSSPWRASLGSFFIGSGLMAARSAVRRRVRPCRR